MSLPLDSPLIASYQATLTHIHPLAKPGTWGTQVELLGAATFYQVPWQHK